MSFIVFNSNAVFRIGNFLDLITIFNLPSTSKSILLQWDFECRVRLF